MTVRLFIDGAAGTTGLEIRDRLADLLLAQVELHRSPVEAQILCHGHEVSEMSKFNQG